MASPSWKRETPASLASAISGANRFVLQHDLVLPPSLSVPLHSLVWSASQRLSLPFRPAALPWFLRLPPLSPLWSLSFNLSHPSFLRLLSLLPNLPPSLLGSLLLRLSHSASYPSLSRLFPLPSPAPLSFFSALHSISQNPHLFIPSPSPVGTLTLTLTRFGPLSLLALLDARGRFLDLSAGWPGTLHPGEILHQSRLYSEMEDKSESQSESGHGVYVFGDPCFPLLPWLLTPYREDDGRELGEVELGFNERHREGMEVVRGVFRRLRKRWRILGKDWKGESVEFLPFVVVVCCLLNNFVESCGEGVVDEGKGEEETEREEEEGFGVFEGEVSESGQKVRDAVAAHLWRVCASQQR